jgi:hypothetical protein
MNYLIFLNSSTMALDVSLLSTDVSLLSSHSRHLVSTDG